MSHSPTPTDLSIDKYGGVSKAKYYRDKRKRAFEETELNGCISLLSCEHCYKRNIRCVVMDRSKGVRCASCAAKGIKCVNVSWGSLDRTREEKKKAINDDLQKLVEITARLERNRRDLELAEKRAKAKTICLLDELEEEDEAQRMRNGGLSDGELEELSRDFVAYNNATENLGDGVWSAWDVSRGTGGEVVESSGGS